MKKSVVSALMVCSLTLAAVATGPLAALADDYDNKIQEQNQKIDDLKSQEATLEEQLNSLSAEISTIKAEGAELSEKQAALSKEISTLQTEIDDLTVRIEKREAAMKSQARTIQVKGSSVSYLDVVMESESISDAITRLQAASKIVNANNDLRKQQEEDKKAVETKKTEASKKSEELQTTIASLDEKAGTLETKQLDQTIVKNDLAAQRATEEGKKAEYQQQKEAAEQQKAEQERVAKEAEERRAQEVAATAAQSNQNAANAVENNSTTPSQNNGSNTDNTGGESTSAPAPDAGIPTPATPVAPPANGSGIVADALAEIGKPYVWGATGPSSFDCSGLTQYVFAKNGISLPRVTTGQEYAGTMISISQLQAGDLVFFGARGATHHVGIYIGGGQYVHAPQPGESVKVTSISGYTPSFGVRVG